MLNGCINVFGFCIFFMANIVIVSNGVHVIVCILGQSLYTYIFVVVCEMAESNVMMFPLCLD